MLKDRASGREEAGEVAVVDCIYISVLILEGKRSIIFALSDSWNFAQFCFKRNNSVM